ncbi:MAG: hypothetical protein WDN72_09810 [Alphaproteobacteria bacterium]
MDVKIDTSFRQDEVDLFLANIPSGLVVSALPHTGKVLSVPKPDGTTGGEENAQADPEERRKAEAAATTVRLRFPMEARARHSPLNALYQQMFEVFLQIHGDLKKRGDVWGRVHLDTDEDGTPMIEISASLFNAMLEEARRDPETFWGKFPRALRTSFIGEAPSGILREQQESLGEFTGGLRGAGILCGERPRFERSNITGASYDVLFEFGPDSKPMADRLKAGLESLKKQLDIEGFAFVGAQSPRSPRDGRVTHSVVKIDWESLQGILTAYRNDPSIVATAFAEGPEAPSGAAARKSSVRE